MPCQPGQFRPWKGSIPEQAGNDKRRNAAPRKGIAGPKHDTRDTGIDRGVLAHEDASHRGDERANDGESDNHLSLQQERHKLHAAIPNFVDSEFARVYSARFA